MDPSVLAVSIDAPAAYLQWGWVLISVPNLIVIATMVILFVLALVLPFPKDRERS